MVLYIKQFHKHVKHISFFDELILFTEIHNIITITFINNVEMQHSQREIFIKCMNCWFTSFRTEWSLDDPELQRANTTDKSQHLSLQHALFLNSFILFLNLRQSKTLFKPYYNFIYSVSNFLQPELYMKITTKTLFYYLYTFIMSACMWMWMTVQTIC